MTPDIQEILESQIACIGDCADVLRKLAEEMVKLQKQVTALTDKIWILEHENQSGT